MLPVPCTKDRAPARHLSGQRQQGRMGSAGLSHHFPLLPGGEYPRGPAPALLCKRYGEGSPILHCHTQLALPQRPTAPQKGFQSPGTRVAPPCWAAVPGDSAVTWQRGRREGAVLLVPPSHCQGATGHARAPKGAGGAQQAGKRRPAAGRVLACPPHPEGWWALEQCSPSQGHGVGKPHQPSLRGLRGLHPAGRTGCAWCHPAEPCAGRGAWVLCPGARPQVKGLGAARGLSFVRRLQSPDAAHPTHALCPRLPAPAQPRARCHRSPGAEKRARD